MFEFPLLKTYLCIYFLPVVRKCQISTSCLGGRGSLPFSIVCVTIDVKCVSPLEKPQEVIALNEPLTGASGLPLSLQREIISLLCFPLRLQMFLFDDEG